MAGKCFLVTGPPGVGKTTLIIRVLERLSASNLSLKLQGFYTREIRERGHRVGFQVVTLDSRTATLASTSAPRPECLNWPSVGRFRVDLASFESLSLPELQAKKDADLFIIDEVGKMELYSPSFFPAVLSILESNISILATVPIPVSGKDIPAVATLKSHPGATLFTLTTSNREAMCDRIYTHLVESMSQK